MSDERGPSAQGTITDRDRLKQRDSEIEAQRGQIESLQHSIEAAKFELPLLRISTHILMVPIVGAMDSLRSQRVMEDVLENIRRAGTKVVVIDISGVNVVDSSVASHLIMMVAASKLMGATTIISGISPSMASNIVKLGIDTGQTETTNTVEDALKRAYNHVGKKLGDA